MACCLLPSASMPARSPSARSGTRRNRTFTRSRHCSLIPNVLGFSRGMRALGGGAGLFWLLLLIGFSVGARLKSVPPGLKSGSQGCGRWTDALGRRHLQRPTSLLRWEGDFSGRIWTRASKPRDGRLHHRGIRHKEQRPIRRKHRLSWLHEAPQVGSCCASTVRRWKRRVTSMK